MVAIVGLPGSQHHDWRWFPRHGTIDGETAEEWTERRCGEALKRNPALGSLPTRIISDREARRVRWLDGSRVYRIEEPSSAY